MLERNRVVGQRIARVMCAASGLMEVPVVDDPAELHKVLSKRPLLLGCDAADLDLALEWAAERYPTLNLMVWTSGNVASVLRAALGEARLSNVMGWPTFESMPRPWEIALSVKRLLNPLAAPPRLSDMLSWGATIVKWRPRSSDERDRAVSEVSHWAERAGAPTRIAERLGELAHELLMNAMYGAPIDRRGRPRYSHDRKQSLTLEENEIPTLRLGTDGERIALQAHDPFGRLRRHDVFEGITRGLSAREVSGGPDDQVLDTSRGGAGLGMLKIYSAGAVLLVDVTPRSSTLVTSFYDLDVNPREFRSLPASVHFFERQAALAEPVEQSER
ncbi:hypothetical protein [Chondromyces crocatus]|uniref:Uncharacterized protein n=1 Tax=Chondromyces crocatus TaxID=52 RepID=A0A0K1E7N7_CHOCO|nr:hypothetical protein [Chondromyces crocatus]AKT36901.1 uncharacterized protein CMC5_010220 [Chondromyces crocatus]